MKITTVSKRSGTRSPRSKTRMSLTASCDLSELVDRRAASLFVTYRRVSEAGSAALFSAPGDPSDVVVAIDGFYRSVKSLPTASLELYHRCEQRQIMVTFDGTSEYPLVIGHSAVQKLAELNMTVWLGAIED